MKEKSIKKKVSQKSQLVEKKPGGFTSSQEKTLSGKKNKERKKKPYEMSPHHIESVSAVENQCSRIQFL